MAPVSAAAHHLPVPSVAEVRHAGAVDVPVFLNHTYTVLNKKTYDALAKALSSGWLPEQFLNVDAQTKRLGNGTEYSGLYLNFGHTYLELLPEGTRGMPPAASCAMFSDETEGGFEKAKAKLEGAFGASNVDVADFTHHYQANPDKPVVPWFKMADAGAHFPAFGASLMEYAAGPNGKPRTRAAEFPRDFEGRSPNKQVKEMTRVTYGLAKADRDLMVKFLRAVGWTHPKGDLGVWHSPSGPGGRQTVNLVDVSTTTGLLKVELSLKQDAAFEQHRFGDATLVVGAPGKRARTATLYLGPVPEGFRASSSDPVDAFGR